MHAPFGSRIPAAFALLPQYRDGLERGLDQHEPDSGSCHLGLPGTEFERPRVSCPQV